MGTSPTIRTFGSSTFLEHLEERRHLANFDLTPTDYGMTLAINGSAGRDVLSVVQKTTYVGHIQHVDFTIMHKGHEQTFNFVAASSDPHDQLTQVVVNGRSGDDRIHAYNRDGLGVGAPTLTLRGGAGDDRIRCRDQFMYAEGGTGNDNLTGRTGTDPASKGHTYAFSFIGDSGNDSFDGSSYADLFHGGSGDDHMRGNAGNDFIKIGLGADMIEAGEGDDTVYVRPSGPIPPSTVMGGDGEDTLIALVSNENTPLDAMFSTLIIDSVEVLDRDVLA